MQQPDKMVARPGITGPPSAAGSSPKPLSQPREESKAPSQPNPKVEVEDDDDDDGGNMESSQEAPSATSSMQSKKDKLRSLFLRYAELAEDTGELGMKSRQFNKLLADTGLFDMVPKFARIQADIIFSSNARSLKGSIPFETFLNCLLKTSEAVYPSLAREKKSKALDRLIAEKLLPFQDRFGATLGEQVSRSPQEQYTSSVSAAVSTYVYDQEVKTLLGSVVEVLRSLYDGYFTAQYKAAKSPEQFMQITTKQIIVFLKDFSLLGRYVQKQLAIVMVDTLVNMPSERLTNSEEVKWVFNDPEDDYGCYFTLARFLVFLFWVAIIGFDATKPEPQTYTPVGTRPIAKHRVEKVFYLLAKLELSEGFATMYKYTVRSGPVPTLMPPEELTAQLVANNPLDLRSRKKRFPPTHGSRMPTLLPHA